MKLVNIFFKLDLSIPNPESLIEIYKQSLKFALPYLTVIAICPLKVNLTALPTKFTKIYLHLVISVIINFIDN